MNFKKYSDDEMMMIDLAQNLAGELRQALKQRERVLLVVPGGTTPGPVFDALSSVDLDWGRVDVMLSDERWVPEVHLRSNTRLLRERLLVGRAAAARYIPLYARADTPEEVLPQIEAGIAPALPISVLLLGMGADMHTASIFPEADLLEEALRSDAPILLPMRAPGAMEPRITLSARVLSEAMNIHIVITGSQKRAAIERAAKMRPQDAPVAAILDGATVHWAP
ncbi:6-phosphogluconolactonase [Litorivita pollutaquae]|uniref:6-phosphogluconolactonase n=1 Tax=Litorivita pollutaquae TaxID=2200892 RepID=A0A2V4NW74_9RHOB|nr:6-phosphogluconolactonase [Litorivita pollutaquae]OUS20941.1 6-phosphogluconolactonase [Rhodobacterales bacterium 59_46_T64]PYC49356.1 6-phosphogluconolactonase [Litorivita pollutaquae]